MSQRLHSGYLLFTAIAFLFGLNGLALAQVSGGNPAHLRTTQYATANTLAGRPVELRLAGNDPYPGPMQGTAEAQRSRDDRGECFPDGLFTQDNGCGPDGSGGEAPQVLLTFYINGTCYVGNLCYTINGGPLNCDFIGSGNDISNGESVNLTGLVPNATYVFYFTTVGGPSDQVTYITGDCEPDPCTPENLVAVANGCTEVEGVLLPTVRLTFGIDGGCVAETLCWTVNGGGEECLDLVDAGAFLNDGDQYDFTGAQLNAAYTFRFTTADGTSGTIPFTTGNCENADCVPDGITFAAGECEEIGGLLYATIVMTFAIDGDCEVEDFCYTVNGQTVCENLPELDIHLGDGEVLFLHQSLPNSTYTITYTTAGGSSGNYTYTTPECFDCFPQSLVLTHGTCQGTKLEIINVRFNIDGTCYAEDLCYTRNGGEVVCLNLPGFETYIYDNYVWQFGNWDGAVTYQFYFTTEGGQSNTYTYIGQNCDPDATNAVEEHSLGDVSIFPNPVQDRLSIRTERSQAYEVTIFDQLGRSMVRTGFSGDRFDLSIASLSAGVYSVVLATAEARAVQRVLKQ